MATSAAPRHAARRAPAHRTGIAQGGWRFPVLAFVAGLAAWLGMCVALYPTVASWFSQYNQSQLVTNYSTEVAAGISPSAAEQLEQAHEYNDALNAGALLEADHRLPTGDGTSTNEDLKYNALLTADTTGMMARIKIPSIDVDLPVYHGTSDETLARGIGHLEGTSLPVGGAGTHAVLTGHRGLATATLFTNLNKVKIGDTFTIEVLDQVLTYRVYDTKVVDPDQTESLLPVEGKDLVTLVTCTPLGINSQRILVTGERITPTPQEDVDAAGAPPDIPGFPWWAVALAGGTVLVGVYIWRSGYPPKAKVKAAGVGAGGVGDADATGTPGSEG
ncbi:class C sortase [Actinomyces provencensis]|uniref:class C sortase n=1 Tax=Actinomyces provencensis TaxID=1720198 RepID=UPI0018A87E4F|nr:class C sortase [Actinomyces provencensis]